MQTVAVDCQVYLKGWLVMASCGIFLSRPVGITGPIVDGRPFAFGMAGIYFRLADWLRGKKHNHSNSILTLVSGRGLRGVSWDVV